MIPIAIASPSVASAFDTLAMLERQLDPLSLSRLSLTVFYLVVMPDLLAFTPVTSTSTPRSTALNTPPSTSPTFPKNSSKNMDLPTKPAMVGSTSIFAKASTAFHRSENLPTASLRSASMNPATTRLIPSLAYVGFY